LNATSIAMRRQTRYGATDPLGPLNLPATLIVPSWLEERANRIVAPSAAYAYGLDNTAGTAAQNPDVDLSIDPHAFAGRGMQVLVNDFLTDQTDWFAVADANKVATLVVGFLNGREDPELFVQDAATVGSVFNADKISYKIRLVFGISTLDHRSFYRQVVT
jgi:hypothetical protein